MTAVRRAVALALSLLLAACAEREPGNDLVFVTDEEADVVHIVDGASGRLEGTLKTGERPRGIALSPDGRTLFVAASDSDRIEQWDPHDRRLLRTYDSGNDPERFVIGPEGKWLYIANEDDSAASFVNLASGEMVREARIGPEPEGMGLSPDGKLLIATAEASSTAHFIDTATGELLDSVIVGTRPRDALFLKDGTELWVSSEVRGTIDVFDVATRKIVHRIDLVPEFPELENVQAVEMEVTRDGHRAFVAMGRGNRVAEIDPETRRVVRSFPTGFRTWGIALSPDEDRLYAASGLSGDMTIVDLATNEVTGTVELGGKPWSLVAVRR